MASWPAAKATRLTKLFDRVSSGRMARKRGGGEKMTMSPTRTEDLSLAVPKFRTRRTSPDRSVGAIDSDGITYTPTKVLASKTSGNGAIAARNHASRRVLKPLRKASASFITRGAHVRGSSLESHVTSSTAVSVAGHPPRLWDAGRTVTDFSGAYRKLEPASTHMIRYSSPSRNPLLSNRARASADPANGTTTDPHDGVSASSSSSARKTRTKPVTRR
mmetsp:Transcript_3906/g.12105  ORF Transcript_3906/g.12105 Transcript_3906/m.12105 type:complete len:218 (+) Transcript_3906:1235-1888(+)